MNPSTTTTAQADHRRILFGPIKAANLLRISIRTLRRMIVAKQIRVIRISERIIRIQQSEIDKILQIDSQIMP